MADKRKSTFKDSKNIKKRRVISLEQKLEVINLWENGESVSSIGRSLSLPRTTVWTIIKDKARIKEAVVASVSLKSTIITKHKSGIIAEMEKLLAIWIQDQMEQNFPVNLKTVQTKAMSLFNELKNKQGGCTRAEETFQFSRGWFHRFKVRANLQRLETFETSKAFPHFLEKIIKDGGYTCHQIFNVDETGLYWKKMPNGTLAQFQEEELSSKDRVTLLLGGNASGDFKLKPLVVYHCENPQALKGYSKPHLPVIWKSNPKACLTANIFEDWFSHHFAPSVENYCIKNNLVFKAILILDNSPGHPQYLCGLNSNIKVVFLPDSDSALQPMDQGVTECFKAFYLKSIFAEFFKSIMNENGPTFQELWTNYNIYKCLKNISESWSEITPNKMREVWRKLCPHLFSNCEEMAETLDKDIADSKENVVEMGKLLGFRDLEVDEVDKLLDSHSVDLTNEDLRELVENADKDENGESGENPNRKVLSIKILSESLKLFEAGMSLLEENDPNTERSTSVRRALTNAYNCYKEIHEEKKSLSTFTKINESRKVQTRQFDLTKILNSIPSTEDQTVTQLKMNH